MAKISRLPKLTQQFQELELPVSKKKVLYRPFTVGEQRQIVIAKSKAKSDTQAVIFAIDILQNCVQGCEIKDLNMFDFQKLFFEIRSTSEGADIHFKLNCEQCKAPNDATFNLKEDLVVVNADKTSKKVSITGINPPIALTLTQPTIISVLTARDGEGTDEEKAFRMIPKCISIVHMGEENINDFSQEEITEFIDQLDSNTFMEITNFIKDGPAYEANKPVVCQYCQHEHRLTREEVAGFFT